MIRHGNWNWHRAAKANDWIKLYVRLYALFLNVIRTKCYLDVRRINKRGKPGKLLKFDTSRYNYAQSAWAKLIRKHFL